MDKNTAPARPARLHNIQIDNRRKLNMSGVDEVISSAENIIAAKTAQGDIVVRGEGMHITKYSADEGLLSVEGLVNSVEYIASGAKKGFLKRILK